VFFSSHVATPRTPTQQRPSPTRTEAEVLKLPLQVPSNIPLLPQLSSSALLCQLQPHSLALPQLQGRGRQEPARPSPNTWLQRADVALCPQVGFMPQRDAGSRSLLPACSRMFAEDRPCPAPSHSAQVSRAWS